MPETQSGKPIVVPPHGSTIKCWYAVEQDTKQGEPRLERRAWSLVGQPSVIIVQYRVDDDPSPNRKQHKTPASRVPPPPRRRNQLVRYDCTTLDALDIYRAMKAKAKTQKAGAKAGKA